MVMTTFTVLLIFKLKDNNSLGKNTANAKAGELPQTGETNDSQKLSVIGMALMGILGLFGLGKKRKKD